MVVIHLLTKIKLVSMKAVENISSVAKFLIKVHRGAHVLINHNAYLSLTMDTSVQNEGWL